MMNFTSGKPELIQAINQRWLFNFWQRSLPDRQVPHWSAVESENLSRIASNLGFLQVTAESGRLRFRIFAHGTTMSEVYGVDDFRGKHLDEIATAGVWVNPLLPYMRAVAGGCPVYTVYDMTDRQGRTVHFERLLLPFTCNGGTVDRILASFEFICPDGGFESRDLMKIQTVPPVLRLSATIA